MAQKVIRNTQEYLETYLPIKAMAERVIRMGKIDYSRWRLDTPEAIVKQVEREMHWIRREHEDWIDRINRKLGG